MSKQKVVIVDDHEHVRDSLDCLLTAANFEVVLFTSAEDFLVFCEQSNVAGVDCLVLDVRLPGLSGIELQVELKSREIRLPIILISAHASLEIAEQGRKNGASILLEKPFDGHVLVEEIQRAIASLQAG